MVDLEKRYMSIESVKEHSIMKQDFFNFYTKGSNISQFYQRNGFLFRAFTPWSSIALVPFFHRLI